MLELRFFLNLSFSIALKADIANILKGILFSVKIYPDIFRKTNNRRVNLFLFIK